MGAARSPTNKPPETAVKGMRCLLAASNSTMRSAKPQHQPQYTSCTYTIERAGKLNVFMTFLQNGAASRIGREKAVLALSSRHEAIQRMKSRGLHFIE